MVNKKKIRKIIFITLTNIGDVVLTLPSLDYLKEKFKEAKFTILSGQHSSILFSNDPRIKENISYNKHASFNDKFALFNKLRKEKFDVIVDLRNTAFRWLAKASFKNPYIIKIPDEIRHVRLKHLYTTKAAFGDNSGFKDVRPAPLSIHIDKQSKDRAAQLLHECGFSKDSDYIIVSPSARSKTKRWHKEGFINICNDLLKHYQIILIGDKNDASVTQDINRHLGNRCIDLSGRTNLLEAITMIKEAKLIICNDSAISHFASYLNKPVIVLFGPTDENKYGSWSKHAVVVRKNTICSPCEGDDCKNDQRCLKNISPQLVLDFAYGLLGGKKISPSLAYRKILITRTDRLGDVLLSTPVIKNLRINMPSAYIAMMVQESLKDVVKGNPYLDEVIMLDKRGKHKGLINSIRFALELKRKNFDLVLILHPTIRIHLILFFARIKERIGYDWKAGFLNTRILKHIKHLGRRHESEYALDFLRELGLVHFNKETFMPIYSDSEKWAETILGQSRHNTNKVVISVHAQASCPSKLWPREYFLHLIEKIIASYKATIVYLGDKVDDVIQEGADTINLTGKTNISQLASILKRSDLFISNDSGPVHMAVALGVPTVSIFGRKQPGLGPRRWGPLGEGNIYIHKDVGCEVCLAHDCKRDFECLKVIDPKEVFSYVVDILSKKTF